MTEYPMTTDAGKPLGAGESILGVIVGSDEGLRVVWTPEFLVLPREARLMVGDCVLQSVDVVPQTETRGDTLMALNRMISRGPMRR